MKYRVERSHAGSRPIQHNSLGSLCPAWPKPASIPAYGWGSSSQTLCFLGCPPSVEVSCYLATTKIGRLVPVQTEAGSVGNAAAMQSKEWIVSPNIPLSHPSDFHSTHPQGSYMLWESGWQIFIRSEWKLKCCQ